jgi:hypothetical protein
MAANGVSNPVSSGNALSIQGKNGEQIKAGQQETIDVAGTGIDADSCLERMRDAFSPPFSIEFIEPALGKDREIALGNHRGDEGGGCYACRRKAA